VSRSVEVTRSHRAGRRGRALLAAALLAAGALLLSACDVQLAPTAASVNGTTISRSQLDGALQAIGQDKGYRCLIELSAYGGQRIDGAGQDTYDAGFTADVLTQLIEAKTLSEYVARLHLGEGSFVPALAREQAAAGLSPPSSSDGESSSCTDSGDEVLDAFSPGYRAIYVGFQADEDALAAHLAGASLSVKGLSSYAEAHRSTTTLDCTSAILVAHRALAEHLRAEVISHKASFAALAKADSLDTSSAADGGALGCLLPSELPAALGKVVAALPLGRVSVPAEYEGNYAIFVVSSHAEESPAQLASQLVTAESSKVTATITALLSHAKVTVSATYGHWAKTSNGFEVVAPGAPPARFVPNSAALLGPSHFVPPTPALPGSSGGSS
jgi:hypothetical protein